MAIVDVSRSLALQAAGREQLVRGAGQTVIRWLARLVAVAAILLAGVSFINQQLIPRPLVGVGFLLLSSSLVVLIADLYRRTAWAAYPEVALSEDLLANAQTNLTDYLSPEATNLILNGQVIQSQATRQYFHPIMLFLAAFRDESRVLLARLTIYLTDQQITAIIHDLQAIDESVGQPNLVPVFAQAAQHALANERTLISNADLILAVSELDPAVHAILEDFHVELNDVARVVDWYERMKQQLLKVPSYERSVGAGIAEDWTAGYAPFLNQYGENLTKAIRDGAYVRRVHGRDTDLATIERYLAKGRSSNVIVVGPAGIGKTSLMWGLARRLEGDDALTSLRYHQVVMIEVERLLAGITNHGEIETRLLRVFDEASSAGNIILCLKNIHLLIGGGDRLGGVDASELLLSALRQPNLQVVAITTPEEYQGRLAANPALASLFERIDLTEPNVEDALNVLEDSVAQVEYDSQSFFTMQALRRIVEITDRYVHDQPFPEKALNALADIASYAQTTKTVWVTAEVVHHVLSEKLKLPLETATAAERDKILNLETELHKTVVAQDEAISAIADALRRARAGMSSGKRPIASFLFLGPTGVGKTESAKALARVYFGSEENMIRFDMSEYQQTDGLVRLIGAPGGQVGVKIGGQLADAVHDHPFSLLLLDELEKAHPQILNLFLQVLDDGRLTDGTGRLIDFTNTIIIATSNAGAELIRSSINANEDQETRRTKLLDFLQSQGIYRPEFLNRFDGVIAFHPLSQDNIRQIVRLMLASLANQLATEKQVTISFADDLVAALAETGFDPQFGARPIRRLIQDKVETHLAQQILEGHLEAHASLELHAPDVGLTVQTTNLRVPAAAPRQSTSLFADDQLARTQTVLSSPIIAQSPTSAIAREQQMLVVNNNATIPQVAATFATQPPVGLPSPTSVSAPVASPLVSQPDDQTI